MVWFGKSADPVIMPRLKLPTFIKIYFYIFIFYCFFLHFAFDKDYEL